MRPSGEIVQLSGNPFVDTGLAVLAAHANVDDVEQLTTGDLRKVHGDGKRLAAWNSSLKCFRMVFTTNSLLTNPSIKEGSRKPAYTAVVNALLDSINADDVLLRCQACGSDRSIDLDALCRRAIPADILGKQKRFIGRDWFPLAGSLGSDAQALPAASQPVRLCAKCLFAVQYLPMGLILLDGRLAVFQSTSLPFWHAIARDVAEEVLRRVSAGNYETMGKKEGRSVFVLRLLDLFERLQSGTSLREVPEGTSLEIWRFSNSGAGAECSTQEIPNPALTFLWESVRSGKRTEIAGLIAKEGSREHSFLRCIAEGTDYGGLYPSARFPGVSPELFYLYQTKVCQRPHRSIEIAALIAETFIKSVRAPELRRAARDGAFDDSTVRNALKSRMIELAERGELTLRQYQSLFPTSIDNGTRVSSDGWRLIRYFLNHAEFVFPKTNQPTDAETNDPHLEYYAFQIFRDYIAHHGLKRFRTHVLDALRRRRISVAWVQDEFARLAEVVDGFSLSNWVTLFGEPAALAEPLFQFQLLWYEWLESPADARIHPKSSESASGLGTPVESALNSAFKRYVAERGLARFHRDIILRLSRREMGLQSLKEWLIRWNSESEDQLCQSCDEVFPDAGDSVGASDFFFKVRLLLGNLYRTQRIVR